jgi:hypothetical protein
MLILSSYAHLSQVISLYLSVPTFVCYSLGIHFNVTPHRGLGLPCGSTSEIFNILLIYHISPRCTTHPTHLSENSSITLTILDKNYREKIQVVKVKIVYRGPSESQHNNYVKNAKAST